MRLFTALRLHPDILRDIARVQRGVAGARWVDEGKLHITTAFYGNVTLDQAETLDYELAQIKQKSLTLQLEGSGHFGSEEPRAIWLGVKQNDGLMALHEKCKIAARRAGLVLEKRKYMPHVTLAYLKHTPPDRVIAFETRTSRFNTKPFLVDEMELQSSWPSPKKSAKGVANTYAVEANYPFLARDSGVSGKV